MAKKRKTNAERQQERDDVTRRVWREFKPKLEGLKTWGEAIELLSSAPGPNDPGRKFYSNLGFFLGDFSVPHGSNRTERELYLKFLQQLDSDGAVKESVHPKIAVLKLAIESSPHDY